jgi:shikimate dehydrogenase
VSGLDLLVHQAALQVELMTGADRAPLAAMRRAGERALAERGASSGDPLP